MFTQTFGIRSNNGNGADPNQRENKEPEPVEEAGNPDFVSKRSLSGEKTGITTIPTCIW